jgi:transcription initiation factor TFIID subunit 9B
MATTAPQTNGIAASSVGTNSQTLQNTQSTAAAPTSQPQAQHQAPPHSPAATAPRPRDARTIELLLISQGVTSYEARVPLLLLDFSYRHASSILNDAIHLSADPYTSHAGGRSSATAGAAAQALAAAGGDATVTANAVRLAIQARLGYQFRGGSGAGGLSKEWLLDVAREKNKVALPKVAPNDWGARLPSERFVLTGVSWGLKDVWAETGDDDSDDDGEEIVLGGGDGAAMDGIETNAEDIGGDGVEGGTMEDVFGGDEMDQAMEG